MKAAFHLGFALVYLFLPGDLVAQMVPPKVALQLNDSAGRPAAISFKELTGYAGVTVCWQGRAFAFISTKLDRLEEAETRAHEAKHQEQMDRFKTCEAFNDWYVTPLGQAEAEAEAYAAGLCRAVELGADPVSRRRAVAELMERNFGAANRLMAVQLVEKYAKGCGLRGY